MESSLTDQMVEMVGKFIDALLRKSRRGQVKWYPADDLGIEMATNDDFAVSLPNHSLNVYRPKKPGRIYFSVLDSSGSSIYVVKAEPESVMYVKLEELLSLAKFKARKLAELLEELMGALETEDEIGLAPEESIPF